MEAAKLERISADDIVHRQADIRALLNRNVTIADLSTLNDAIYELCAVIRPYEHLGTGTGTGTGIDFEEAERLKGELVKTLKPIVSSNALDSAYS